MLDSLEFREIFFVRKVGSEVVIADADSGNFRMSLSLEQLLLLSEELRDLAQSGVDR
jgi:hypothetical protein